MKLIINIQRTAITEISAKQLEQYNTEQHHMIPNPHIYYIIRIRIKFTTNFLGYIERLK